jgi:hypothetical protein
MKYPTSIIAMSNFQRDPSLSTRVLPSLYAWRALINLFDQSGVGRITISLLTKSLRFMDIVRAYTLTYLQRIQHCYQNINEDEHMVNEKLLVAATTPPLALLYATTLTKVRIHLMPDPINPRFLRKYRVPKPETEDGEILPPKHVPHT